MTLAEQAVAAELAYYRQLDLCSPTVADWTTWQHKQACYEVAHATRTFPGDLDSSLYARHVLERHGYSLHHYMAYHLGVEAWKLWFSQVDFIDPLLEIFQPVTITCTQKPVLPDVAQPRGGQP